MEKVLQTILERRSIRKFKDAPVDDETIKKVLSAAMAGPSAVNARDWCFVVVNDKETKEKWAKVCGRAENIVLGSGFSVLICADMDKAFSRAKEYWIINGSIAGQNMVLAAEDLGLGSVWLGIWPQMEKVEAQKQYFELPETIEPLAIIAFGYPDEIKQPNEVNYEEDKVHFNKW